MASHLGWRAAFFIALTVFNAHMPHSFVVPRGRARIHVARAAMLARALPEDPEHFDPFAIIFSAHLLGRLSRIQHRQHFDLCKVTVDAEDAVLSCREPGLVLQTFVWLDL